MDKKTQFKFGYNKDISDKFDWRIKYIGNLESELEKVPGDDSTHNWDIGSVFFIKQPFIFDKEKISLNIPNMTAINLNISNNNFITAREKLKKYKESINKSLEVENSYDFIENMTVSIVFAVSALEVFFKQLLLDKNRDIVFLTKKNKKGEEKELKVKDIEWENLENKFLHIFPIMFQIESENFEVISSKLKDLIKLRNDIIHLKSSDLQPHTDTKKQTTIWKRIFDKSKSNPAMISVSIMKFYYEKSGMELPRFLRLLPFKK